MRGRWRLVLPYLEMKSDFRPRRVARGGDTLHSVCLRNHAEVDVEVCLVSTCRANWVTYPGGSVWEPDCLVLSGFDLRDAAEDCVEEYLIASSRAESGRRTQLWLQITCVAIAGGVVDSVGPVASHLKVE